MATGRQGPRRPARTRSPRGRSARPERLAPGQARGVDRPRKENARRDEDPRRKQRDEGPRRKQPEQPPREPREPRELIIGRHPVVEALRAGRRVHRVMIGAGAHGAGVEEVTRLARERSVPVAEVPRERLDALSDHHQGIIADAAPFEYADLDELIAAAGAAASQQPPLVLAVDAVQDPQNFGNLLRTALAAGALGAVLPERRSVGVTPAVGRASAGAIERLRICRVVNLVRALRQFKAAGLWIVGLDGAATTAYDQVDLTVPLVVVVGSEGSGLGRLVAETCDVLVSLPMVGPTESLNAAVAGSIVLYEALRQRRTRGDSVG